MSTVEKLIEHLEGTLIGTGLTLGSHTSKFDRECIAESVMEFFGRYSRPWILMSQITPDRLHKQRSILVYHDEEAADYDTEHAYHLHRKGGMRSDSGIYIAIWGGDCWFERDSDFSQPLYPVKWMPLPQD